MKNKPSWLNPKVEVRNTARYGKGIFVKQAVLKGERIVIFGGDIMLIDEVAHLPSELQHHALQIEERFVLGWSRYATEPEDSDFFNHSCEPNCGIKGQIFLVAMKDIAVDEEITFDYAMCVSESLESNLIFAMQCDCGAASCRKKVTEQDWKLPLLQKKYHGYFSQYLQEKIDAAHVLIKSKCYDCEEPIGAE